MLDCEAEHQRSSFEAVVEKITNLDYLVSLKETSSRDRNDAKAGCNWPPHRELTFVERQDSDD